MRELRLWNKIWIYTCPSASKRTVSKALKATEMFMRRAHFSDRPSLDFLLPTNRKYHSGQVAANVHIAYFKNTE